MKLMVQPDAGIAPIVTAIKQAKKSIDILIFRLDRFEIARALAAAVARGVRVRALTAHTNRGGTKSLRKLELSLLEAGVTVSRTADDLVRYHGKMMIVDNKFLHVYGFNFTGLDIAKSRSFGIISKNRRIVGEALRLFEADCTRQPYTCGDDMFVVSPQNARARLTRYLSKARKQLLIYDPKIADPAMITILQERAKAGVDVRVMGKLGTRGAGLKVQKYPGRRLHVRAIVRDGARAFVGSQSLRKAELDARREVGVIVRDAKIVKRIAAIFEDDWALTDLGKQEGVGAKEALSA